ASIDFRVDRDGSRELARKFLSEQTAFNDSGYRRAAIFNYNETTKLYLERSLGLEKMNRLTQTGSGPIRIWRWTHRWFKPLEKEEFQADISAAGEVVGFVHELPEAAAGANLAPEPARRIAEAFLMQVLGRNLEALEFLDAEKEIRANRTD